MDTSFRDISRLLAAQFSGVDGSVESVLQWISFLQEGWLIVFDNAVPSTEVVEKFIPPGNGGNILIISRNKSMRRIVLYEIRIEIQETEGADAITLLPKSSHLDPLLEHLEEAQGTVTGLCCIPLAIDNVGSSIKAGSCDIDQLRQFSVHRQALMSNAAFTRASECNKTVYETWDLSFKEIEKRAGGHSTPKDAQAAHAAILIFQICSFYHHTNISKDIFRSAAEEAMKQDVGSDRFRNLPQAFTLLDYTLLGLDNDGNWDEFIFEQGISVLMSFSLIKREQPFETFSVHPLVQNWSRERMSKSEQEKIYKIGSAILSCAIPWRFEIQNYKLRRTIFPHIKAIMMHELQMGLIREYYDDKWVNFALVLNENGDFNKAEQLEVQVMEMRKNLLGAEHPDTLTAIGNLASSYMHQGRWNEAEQLEVQVVDLRKKLLGEEHPDTLTAIGNLASTYMNQGRWNEAEQLEVQVMDMRKKLLGAEHPDTLNSMAQLASTYMHQGRWNEAEKLEVQVMEMRKKLLGAEHPDTLITIGNLASTYMCQGRWDEAEQLEVEVICMRKKFLGEEHPETLTAIGNLASTYIHQGRWNEAEKLEVQVMDMRKKLLGADHPDTLSSMGNLAGIYKLQERWNEAELLEIQVMDLRKKCLGADHPDTLTSIANLASTYRLQERWDESEKLEILVMDMKKKLLGADHPDTLISIEILARIYKSSRKVE